MLRFVNTIQSAELLAAGGPVEVSGAQECTDCDSREQDIQFSWQVRYNATPGSGMDARQHSGPNQPVLTR